MNTEEYEIKKKKNIKITYEKYKDYTKQIKSSLKKEGRLIVFETRDGSYFTTNEVVEIVTKYGFTCVFKETSLNRYDFLIFKKI